MLSIAPGPPQSELIEDGLTDRRGFLSKCGKIKLGSTELPVAIS